MPYVCSNDLSYLHFQCGIHGVKSLALPKYFPRENSEAFQTLSYSHYIYENRQGGDY